MASFSVEAMVRISGLLLLAKNIHASVDGNRVDPFAVAVMRGDAVIGHVPRKISSVGSLYLCRDGSIVCREGRPKA